MLFGGWGVGIQSGWLGTLAKIIYPLCNQEQSGTYSLPVFYLLFASVLLLTMVKLNLKLREQNTFLEYLRHTLDSPLLCLRGNIIPQRVTRIVHSGNRCFIGPTAPMRDRHMAIAHSCMTPFAIMHNELTSKAWIPPECTFLRDPVVGSLSLESKAIWHFATLPENCQG